VKLLKPVSYIESLRLASESSGLLLIDAPAQLSVFLPSKLVDYIGTQRPIFGVTPEGTSRELILRSGGLCADPTNPNEIADRLKDFIVSISSFEPKMEIANQFSSSQIAIQMDAALKEILEDNK